VTATAGQPRRRDDGSKAAVNLKRRYGKRTRTTTSTRWATNSKSEVAFSGRTWPARATAPRVPKHSAAQKLGGSRRFSQYQNETKPSNPNAVALTYPRMSLTVSAITL